MSSNEFFRPCPDSVFILGAGFSKALSAEMPLLNELSTAIERRLDRPISQTIPFLVNDVEMAMTFLSQPQPWMTEAQQLRNRADFLDLTQAIAAEIIERSSAVQKKTIPHWFIRFIHWLHFNKATVISFNYDTLIESAVSTIVGGPYARVLIPVDFLADDLLPSNAQSGDSFELLKLHGSVNWRFSGRTDHAGEPLRYLRVADWSTAQPSLPAAESTVGTVPLIIPPVADKGGFFIHHSIHYLWRRARYCLASAKRVFCIGYSFPVTDLTIRFLMQDLKRKDALDVYVVNLSGSAEHYRNILSQAPVSIHDCFVSDDPTKSLLDALDTFTISNQSFATEHHVGPVETAIRKRILLGAKISTESPLSTLVVKEQNDSDIVFLIEAAEIPIHLPWFCLETLAIKVREAWRGIMDIDEIDRTQILRVHCDRNLSVYVSALLRHAGIFDVLWDVNRWVVMLSGENFAERESMKQTASIFGDQGKIWGTEMIPCHENGPLSSPLRHDG